MIFFTKGREDSFSTAFYPNMQVFGLLEESGVENKNMQTSHGLCWDLNQETSTV